MFLMMMTLFSKIAIFKFFSIFFLNNQIDIDKNKLIIEKLKTPSNKDVFDDDDFIFKECYI